MDQMLQKSALRREKRVVEDIAENSLQPLWKMSHFIKRYSVIKQ